MRLTKSGLQLVLGNPMLFANRLGASLEKEFGRLSLSRSIQTPQRLRQRNSREHRLLSNGSCLFQTESVRQTRLSSRRRWFSLLSVQATQMRTLIAMFLLVPRRQTRRARRSRAAEAHL